jgi:beta-glucosidase
VLHGYRSIVPNPLGETSAFDPDLWQRTAALAARETAQDAIALTFAPMLDVARDPRWGRMAECAGEDPFVTLVYAQAKVKGFQGTGEQWLAKDQVVAACAKHFAAYGAVRAGLDYSSVDISEQHLYEVYLPPFRAAVEAGVASIMPAFVDLGGMPMSAHRHLLTTVARERWGFEGVYISDYAAVAELVPHGLAADLAEAAGYALKAGMDIDMVADAFTRGLPEALQRGLITLEDIDAAVLRVLRLKQKLGLFEDPYRLGGKDPVPITISTQDRALAREAALKAPVLLKNGQSHLPLQSQGGSILVLSALAPDDGTMIGPWNALGEPNDVSPLPQALQKALPDRRIDALSLACLDTLSDAQSKDALAAASKADTILLWLGETPDLSGEAGSRLEPVIPAGQRQLFEKINALGKPMILMLCAGRPLISPEILAACPTVVVTWFLGIEAGPALAQLLTGQHDFTGRLPVSWPAQIGQIPVYFGDRSTGRPANPADRFTSRYLDGPVAPLYPFGHGLSYADITLEQVTVTHEKSAQEKIHITANLTNHSRSDGEQTLFLFIRDIASVPTRPKLELRGFKKIKLGGQQKGSVELTLSRSDLSRDAHQDSRADNGAYEILIGFNANPEQLRGETITLT